MTTPTYEDGIAKVALRGVRGMIADKMQKSLLEAAQLTHHASCNATNLLAAKARYAEAGTKVSIEDLLMQVVTEVLQRHPDINGTVEGKEVHLAEAVHLSVAMALPGNLLVAPAIFDAQVKDIQGLREARQDLSARAKTNKLSVTEMTGGTFTVSNLGLTRVHYFTPILNTPQIGILGIGCTEMKPVATEDGSYRMAPHIGLSLTFDHRAIDGAPAAEFLTDVCTSIEDLK
ncbi:2-oxo acid dehydrogenase subunit E2 [Leisingera sp. SS27]|uniref:2-oxo acid dehydrogenase subunit E2 n=1 Tax=Leisingera sp. SS27 TaxID=2979462 RepID=UPI00232CDF2B|nr:2-oxo acid dehydrogenase subunit E2 [Leisingera sp. SS27]MDC0660569.1 2-oxo acid dehydrogenase subunit E2 [Leisingera sp. SS27]